MINHTLLSWGISFNPINDITLLSLLVISVGWDVTSRKIPNNLVVAGLITSLIIQFFLGGNIFSSWALGLFVGFSTLFPLYLFRTMGAGDVKLMAMVGAFLGPTAILNVTITTLLAGGLIGIVLTISNGSFWHTMKTVKFMLTNSILDSLVGEGLKIEKLSSSAGTMPYAVAITTGTIIHLFMTHMGYATLV